MNFLIGLMVLPACAVVAGLVVWESVRRQSLDDGTLLRNFSIVLLLAVALAWGLLRTDAARLQLDPVFRFQTEIAAHPVYAAIQANAPDDAGELHDFLALRVAAGVSLPDAFLQARNLLTRQAVHRSGWVDAQTRIAWARINVDTLKELQARHPQDCYRAVWGQDLDAAVLANGFSQGNTAAFQQAVARIYESAGIGMRGGHPPAGRRIEFNEAALEYRVVRESLVQRFGEPVVVQLESSSVPSKPAATTGVICSARIAQLQGMLERPPAMASRLLDSVLRR
ncbi:MAG TPA: hypothetical protein VGE22_18845 [Solimonas sp.]